MARLKKSPPIECYAEAEKVDGEWRGVAVIQPTKINGVFKGTRKLEVPFSMDGMTVKYFFQEENPKFVKQDARFMYSIMSLLNDLSPTVRFSAETSRADWFSTETCYLFLPENIGGKYGDEGGRRARGTCQRSQSGKGSASEHS
ncbi:MAG: hypothetical protein KKF56_00360 [Nanoarchaeota archaeon]|nr:hypothetical protein [Nanoarchaeota archaeon]